MHALECFQWCCEGKGLQSELDEEAAVRQDIFVENKHQHMTLPLGIYFFCTAVLS
jgi:hypothetical protein